MASIGHPVVGDTLYGAPAEIRHESGGPELSLDRNFLHAAGLEFAHPLTRKPLHLESDLPPELRAFLGILQEGPEKEPQAVAEAPSRKKSRGTKE
jgi:23S rRNA pseudouridine1911/1915/1917 synthase